MIFMSTGGVQGQPASGLVGEWVSHGISEIELSGGAYKESLLKDLIAWRSKVNFRVHNYFPPPEQPFVFNLGSLNPEIADLSMTHAREAIHWAVELASPVYSFHAGYLVDPHLKELGGKFTTKKIYNRGDSYNYFVERVNKLADLASRNGIQLLIENNVLASNNYKNYGLDPLLMTTPEECRNIMQDTPDNVNLLVDVAHLKVSACTLGYDPSLMFLQCSKWIKAYHLSDNDGLCDNNEAVRADSWFWPFLSAGHNYFSLEVYNTSIRQLVQQKKLVEQIISERKLL